MSEPKIVTLDIERQSAIASSVWQLKQYGYIRPGQIIIPVRTICFSWKWWGDDKMNFSSEWDPFNDGNVGEPQPFGNTGLLEVYPGHKQMIQIARDVLDRADFVVGWNSKQYDIGSLRQHFAEYDLQPPSPHQDIDLIKTSRSQFNFMSHTLDEAAPHFGLGHKRENPPGLWEKLRWLPYQKTPEARSELALLRSQMDLYNGRDVELTEQIFMKMIPWIPRLNLYANPELGEGLDIRCRKCNSPDLIWQGYRRNTTRMYHRYQCVTCRSWGQEVKSVYGMETSSS